MVSDYDYYLPAPNQYDFWQKRRVLITGASGFIGTNLVGTLLKLNAEVHILVREASDLSRLKLLLKSLVVHRSAMENEAGVFEAVNHSRPDIIFHLATPRGLDRRSLLEGNILGAFHLSEAIRQIEVSHLIMAGSYLEYGFNSEAHKETDLLFPNTWHGAVKVAAGHLLRQATLSKNNFTLLRIFHVYGPWESEHRFIPTLIKSALTNKPLQLSSSLFRRDWIHVFDVVNALLKAGMASNKNCTFNIGTGLEYSVQEVVCCLEKIINKQIPIAEENLQPRLTDNIHNCADIENTKNELNWRPLYSIKDGLEQTIKWFQTNRYWDDFINNKKVEVM